MKTLIIAQKEKCKEICAVLDVTQEWQTDNSGDAMNISVNKVVNKVQIGNVLDLQKKNPFDLVFRIDRKRTGRDDTLYKFDFIRVTRSEKLVNKNDVISYRFIRHLSLKDYEYESHTQSDDNDFQSYTDYEEMKDRMILEFDKGVFVSSIEYTLGVGEYYI